MIPTKLDHFEDSDQAPLAADLTNSLARLLDKARRDLDGDREAAKATIARASSLLQVEIDRKAAQDAPASLTQGALAAWQVNRVKAYVDARLDSPIHINHLAAVAQRSAAYFCRAFKRTFGETPHAFIVTRRLNRASELMLASDLSLSEIAVGCGFTDQAHLCKVFRARQGQSPAVWRRERRDLSHPMTASRAGGRAATSTHPLQQTH